MHYEIHVKQAPPQVVATDRCHTRLSELGNVMHATLGKVASSIEPAAAAQGAPFAVYYNEPFRPDDIDVEMGVPVAPDAKIEETRGVHRRELPGGPVAHTLHAGPYARIGEAYEALYAWVAQHGHKRTGPPREIYLVGPMQGASPKEFRTEIEVPID